MQKITKWKTNDGKEFENKKDAEAYEFSKIGAARVDKWLSMKKVELKVTDGAGHDNLDLVILTILQDLKGFVNFVTSKDKTKKVQASTASGTPTPQVPQKTKKKAS